MKIKWLMLLACTALAAVQGPILADHNSFWEEGRKSTQPFDQLSARLNPEPDFQGGGRAKYKVFGDEQSAIERTFIVNTRLRLIRGNGSVANELLGLTEENAPAAGVTAYLVREAGPEELVDFVVCALEFTGFILDEYEIAYYASYRLELKEQDGGIVTSQGFCVDAAQMEILPVVMEFDRIEIGVATDVVPDEIRPVLTGVF